MGYLLLGNIKKQAERAHHKLYHFVGNSVWLDFINIPLTQVLQGCHCSMVVRVHLKYENKMEKFKMRCELCFTLSTFWSVRRIEINNQRLMSFFAWENLTISWKATNGNGFLPLLWYLASFDFYFMYLESSQNSC